MMTHTLSLANESQSDKMEQSGEGVDMVAISQILLRVLAQLEEREYTDLQKERQADVVVHDDPPDPASDVDTARG
jgi:hypothetical protein